MKKVTLISLLLFSFSLVAYANYYAQDYDPDYLPYNFQDALDSGYDNCELIIEEYDSGYWQLDEKFNSNNYTGSDWVQVGASKSWNFDQLRDRTEEEIRLCVIEGREKAEQNTKEELDIEARAAARDCDFDAIEYLEEIESGPIVPYRAQVRECYAQAAVDVCDMDEIEDFRDTLRMKFYDEILACEAKANEPVPTPVEVTPVVISEPVVPQYIPPAAPVMTPQPAIEEEPEEIVEEEVSTSTPTTTEETIEVTQEELDRMVEEKLSEKLNEAQQEPEPEPKPSFFKRAVNFLFGWMF